MTKPKVVMMSRLMPWPMMTHVYCTVSSAKLLCHHVSLQKFSLAVGLNKLDYARLSSNCTHACSTATAYDAHCECEQTINSITAFFSQIDIPYQFRIRSDISMSLINKTNFLNYADFIIRTYAL